MDEPSILDYLKSLFKIDQQEEIPFPVDQSFEIEEGLKSSISGKIPWRSMLALFFALIGQRFFEPSSRNGILGIGFYLLSLVLLFWSIFRSEWIIAPSREYEPAKDSFDIRPYFLILAAISGLIAFALFGGNLFTPLNIILWLISITSLIWTFWVRKSAAESDWEEIKNRVHLAIKKIKFFRWHVLVILAILLVVFFRVYQINLIPMEPFSDHAEKILDVYDVTQGDTHIFFPRNTGREGFQMYLTVLIASIFGTGISFLSLKIGTVLCGLLTLPYMYKLGIEFGNRRVGLLAMFFTGIAYWPNVISRVGLRFPLYPLFAAPLLFYLVRGLRTSNRNDFLLAGLFLGLGLHGYSPFRIVPLLAVLGVILFIFHKRSRGYRQQTLIWLVLLAITSLFIFMPLLRYWIQNPADFSYRAFSRLGGIEQSFPVDWWSVLFSNIWNANGMFNWSDGQIWVNSIPNRPALDIVSGAFLILGLILLLVRYFKTRDWKDLFLLLSIQVLMLPSILSLAFPLENPALNRAGAAYIPVFIVIALAMDGLLESIDSIKAKKTGVILAGVVSISLLGFSIIQNYDLVFNKYNQQFRLASWNSSEMGEVISQYGASYGNTDTAWVIPYPHWVDTRLPGVWAGIPNRDFAISGDNLSDTLSIPGTKLFIYNILDEDSGMLLRDIYPMGSVSLYISETPGHDFMVFFVPYQ